MFFILTCIRRSSSNGSDVLLEKPGLGEDPTTVNALEFTSRPLWLNFPASELPSAELPTKERLQKGLSWAAHLGSAAESGISVIFQKTSATELFNPTFSLYVSILHKMLVGRKVFETVMAGPKSDELKMFTQCTHNMSGAFTVMGVNAKATKQKISSKLATATTGSTYQQYVLTQNELGDVQLNGKTMEFEAPIRPLVKSRKPNRMMSFSMPGNSVTFWVFADASIKECCTTCPFAIPETIVSRQKSASDKLLHELLLESAAVTPSRGKRELEIMKSMESINKIFTEKPLLEPIKRELLTKMLALVNDLQRMTSELKANPEIKPLHLELKDIEQLLKNEPFPIKVEHVDDPKQRDQMRQKCKIIAHTLEQQCLRELEPAHPVMPMRGLHLKRMRRSIGRQPEYDEIRTNTILRDNRKDLGKATNKGVGKLVEDPLVSLISAIYYPDKQNMLKEYRVRTTTATPDIPVEMAQQIAAKPYESPKFMKTFTKVVDKVMDLVNLHVARWWHVLT